MITSIKVDDMIIITGYFWSRYGYTKSQESVSVFVHSLQCSLLYQLYRKNSCSTQLSLLGFYLYESYKYSKHTSIPVIRAGITAIVFKGQDNNKYTSTECTYEMYNIFLQNCSWTERQRNENHKHLSRLNAQVYNSCHLNFQISPPEMLHSVVQMVSQVKELLMPTLEVQHLHDMLFQQDEGPPYYHKNLTDFLHCKFQEKWISRGGPTTWLPHLTPHTIPDFFFCGYIKDIVVPS
jgi:hypothetical protein